MDRQQRINILRQIALEQATETYNEEYLLSVDEETLVQKGLSKLLAIIGDFDGDFILDVAFDSLVDINYHSAAIKIREIKGEI